MMKKWFAEKLGKMAVAEVKKSFSEVSYHGWYQPEVDSELKSQFAKMKKEQPVH